MTLIQEQWEQFFDEQYLPVGTGLFVTGVIVLVRRRFRASYTPDNVVVSAAGSLVHEEFVARFRQYFDDGGALDVLLTPTEDRHRA